MAGIFRLGLYEVDNTFGLVSLDVAARMLNKTQPEMIQLAFDDIYAAADVAASIPQILGDRYVTQDWTTMNRTLFEALLLEKMAVSITIGLIVMVAALNIVASLVLLVMEKTPDIAILKTMGATSRSVMYIFMLQGLIIGSIGTAIGTVTGVAISWVMNRYQLLRVPGMGEVYQISYVPFTLRPFELLVVVTGRSADLLPRDDLPIASGCQAEAGGSAAIWVGGSVLSWGRSETRLGHRYPRKSLFPKKISGILLDAVSTQGGIAMRAAFGAVAGSIGGWRDARVVQPGRAERVQWRDDHTDHADAGRPGWHRAAISGAGRSERLRPAAARAADGLVAVLADP